MNEKCEKKIFLMIFYVAITLKKKRFPSLTYIYFEGESKSVREGAVLI